MRFSSAIATALVVTAISCATVPCAFAAGAGNGAGQGAMLRDGSCGRAFACATQNLRSILAMAGQGGGAYFVDADGDGVCDNLGTNAGQGAGQGQGQGRGQGAGVNQGAGMGQSAGMGQGRGGRGGR